MRSVKQDPQRLAFWERHVRSFQDSGLSKAGYCREHDLIYHQFIYWQTKLTDQPTTALASSARPSKLVPVIIPPDVSEPRVRVHLPNGVMISGIDKYSVGLIGQLIEQL